ncbi:RNA-processing protein [Candidatus Woesearchaeota archaeon]|nr:RNA-processing protein [Candidatus Woesearchaeota archaeon]
MFELKIPKSRVGVLIGKKGETKRLVEKNTKCKLEVSEEGDVIVYGNSVDEFICESVIKAIGRGFNPIKALNLVNEEYLLEVISIKEFTGNSDKKFRRIKARLIGTKGKARKVIERLTSCDMVVFGKTVSLIGKIEMIGIARKGVEKLLSGSPHGNVYGFIENEIRKIKTK